MADDVLTPLSDGASTGRHRAFREGGALWSLSHRKGGVMGVGQLMWSPPEGPCDEADEAETPAHL